MCRKQAHYRMALFFHALLFEPRSPLYKMAKSYMRLLMPSHAKRVQQYADPIPLFHRFSLFSSARTVPTHTKQRHRTIVRHVHERNLIGDSLNLLFSIERTVGVKIRARALPTGRNQRCLGRLPSGSNWA